MKTGRWFRGRSVAVAATGLAVPAVVAPAVAPLMERAHAEDEKATTTLNVVYSDIGGGLRNVTKITATYNASICQWKGGMTVAQPSQPQTKSYSPVTNGCTAPAQVEWTTLYGNYPAGTQFCGSFYQSFQVQGAACQTLN